MDNVGSVYLIVIIYIMRLFVLLCYKIRVVAYNKGQKYYDKLFKELFFSSLYVLFIEGYMEFCIAGYLSFVGSKYRTEMFWGEVISLLISRFCTFIAIVFLPLSFIFVLSRPKNIIQSQEFEVTYGMLYHGLKTNSKFQVSYYFVFIIRRISFLLCAFKLHNYPHF